MPKTNINDTTIDGFRTEVSWRPRWRDCGCGTSWAAGNPGAPTECPKCGGPGEVREGHVQIATANQHSPFEFPEQDTGDTYETAEPFNGWRVTLDVEQLDRLIQALQDAKRAAFSG